MLKIYLAPKILIKHQRHPTKKRHLLFFPSTLPLNHSLTLATNQQVGQLLILLLPWCQLSKNRQKAGGDSEFGVLY